MHFLVFSDQISVEHKMKIIFADTMAVHKVIMKCEAPKTAKNAIKADQILFLGHCVPLVLIACVYVTLYSQVRAHRCPR